MMYTLREHPFCSEINCFLCTTTTQQWMILDGGNRVRLLLFGRRGVVSHARHRPRNYKNHYPSTKGVFVYDTHRVINRVIFWAFVVSWFFVATLVAPKKFRHAMTHRNSELNNRQFLDWPWPIRHTLQSNSIYYVV
jgi:hypothetical protein